MFSTRPMIGTPAFDEQVDRAARVDQRQVLRGRDDHRAGGLVLGDHRQLDVAGAGRQVEDQRVGGAPMRVEQLAERVAEHRPAPRDRLILRHQHAHRHDRHARGGLDRDHAVVARLGLVSLDPEQPRLRRAGDIGVDQPDRAALAGRARPRGWPRRSICRPRPCRWRPRSAGAATRLAVRATRTSSPAGAAAARACASRASASRLGQAGHVEDDAGAAVGDARGRAVGQAGDGGLCHRTRDLGHARALRHCFSRGDAPIKTCMSIFSGLAPVATRLAASCATNRRRARGAASPAVAAAVTTARAAAATAAAAQSLVVPARGTPPQARRPERARRIAEARQARRRRRWPGFRRRLARRRRRRASCGRSASALIVAVWLVFTSFQSIGPQERGVVTFFGRYSRHRSSRAST